MNKRVLILNWRSYKDPGAGGAEIATFEFAKRWVSKFGAYVEWLSPIYDAKIKTEDIDGVKFKYISPTLRKSIFGMAVTYSIYFVTVVKEVVARGDNFDVIIDQAHGIPFLTPLYAKTSVILFINEVAGKIWDKMYPFPINILGRLIEKFSLRLYRGKKVITISESTQQDLIALGIPAENISLVRPSTFLSKVPAEINKEKDFTLVFLNRVVKMKGIERALRVLSLLKKKLPDAKLWVVGKGDDSYIQEIRLLCASLGILGSVKFFGFVSQDEKVDLLARAHVLINPSYKEGWGIVNLEANTCHTPAVAFDVPGNRESIQDGVSGYLAPDDDFSAMVENIIRVQNAGNTMQNSAFNFAKRFSWDEQAEIFYNLI